VTILVLSAVFPPKIGGSGRWLWELYRRINSHRIHVVASVMPGAEEFDATSELTIHRMPLQLSNWGLFDPRGGLQYGRAFARLNRLVSQLQPDVIHCGKCLPEGLLALLVKHRRGIPFCCFAHGEELTLADTSHELRWLTRRVSAASRLIVANTENTRQIVMTTFRAPKEKVVVLHPGVDASRFKPAAPDPAVRRWLGWEGRKVVLTVGALQRRKGQDMFIRALPAIRRQCPDVLYAMIGEGWEKEYLEKLVGEHGVGDVVQFRGIPNDDELILCYQQCDLFALPNRQVDYDIEGFGIVLIEAQACGKPVVAGRSGGTREALEPGRTGELIACETPDELAIVIPALLHDESRRAVMGAHGREHVLARFDWAVLTRKAEAFFNATAGPGSTQNSV
jgi:phosphatidyl-myo-inositol dimannoside synthase